MYNFQIKNFPKGIFWQKNMKRYFGMRKAKITSFSETQLETRKAT